MFNVIFQYLRIYNNNRLSLQTIKRFKIFLVRFLTIFVEKVKFQMSVMLYDNEKLKRCWYFITNYQYDQIYRERRVNNLTLVCYRYIFLVFNVNLHYLWSHNNGSFYQVYLLKLFIAATLFLQTIKCLWHNQIFIGISNNINSSIDK